MHKTTFYLPDDLRSELRRLAAETGQSESELVREGIRLTTARHRPTAPRAGISESGDPNLSERVDELLEGFGRR